ncbi:hypothetical protein MA16_Dca023922 [Dendrobium catenatum]|uniref:Uncharacterized protein n=1 Tax=Dendrobium catenatum TaxID=906689 RepID=A0A2I0VXV0_9ASPA|nr:hypothetical protein MA16_Dca023922 [Dendrobium catenatum]
MMKHFHNFCTILFGFFYDFVELYAISPMGYLGYPSISLLVLRMYLSPSELIKAMRVASVNAKGNEKTQQQCMKQQC